MERWAADPLELSGDASVAGGRLKRKRKPAVRGPGHIWVAQFRRWGEDRTVGATQDTRWLVLDLRAGTRSILITAHDGRYQWEQKHSENGMRAAQRTDGWGPLTLWEPGNPKEESRTGTAQQTRGSARPGPQERLLVRGSEEGLRDTHSKNDQGFPKPKERHPPAHGRCFLQEP